ncbi:hypothetical protein DDQ41_29180 [Streptomyces spongiicola]|uniref:Asp/Glu racemase n=1 Tax=Streptomyces spongiicola TaxID=1690221 RepID=A0ABM6VE58_9ACTN|nr:hypothetical protein [Streptomyces spongiicola]AWK12317.1 hypothetical protein DDQ41_29180 [Streptomyces spongiicola]
MSPPPDGTLTTLQALDAAAGRTIRVGLLLPWANVAVESELPRLNLRHTVFHHARLMPASRTTAIDASFWHGLREASVRALDSLLHVPLDVVMLACTSAHFTGGPPLPSGVLTAFDALLHALGEVAEARVVLVTPYPEPVTEAEAAAFTAAGVEVLAHASLGLTDGYPRVTREQVIALVERIPQDAVDAAGALVLSCTGWHTLPVIDELEHRLGKPVLSSNLAMALLAVRVPAGVGS